MRGYAGVIVFAGDDVLLVQEPNYFTGTPEWTFPSGGIEDGESPAVAAARELAEESGCTIDPARLQLVGTASVEHRGRRLSESWTFVAETTDTRLAPVSDPDETVTAAGWFNRAEAQRLLAELRYPPKREPALHYLATGDGGAGWTFELVDRDARIPEFRWTDPESSSDPEAVDGESAARRRLGASFAAGGELYERLRPGYPVEAVTWMVDGVPSTGSVADIGAGTGKLTAALVSRGFDVTAVDPSEDMLAQLSRRIPGVGTHLGTGEATGLAAGTIDLATFAQSWHWVEPKAGCAELARLLTPGGRAAWIWNFMDVRVDWVAQLADIWHTVSGAEATDSARNVPVLSADFEPADSITVDWIEPMRRADLAALVTTRSYYLNATSSEQHQIRDDVDAFLGAQFPADDVIDLPYRTHTYRASRR